MGLDPILSSIPIDQVLVEVLLRQDSIEIAVGKKRMEDRSRDGITNWGLHRSINCL
jgi:hypothetical protein